MARNRTIRTEHWKDEVSGALSFPARLLELGMRNFADDEGLVRWSAEYLRGALFAYSQDTTVERVAAWMREVEDAKIVHVYSSTRVNHKIAYIVGFRRGPLAQRIEKPGPAMLPVPNYRDPAVVLVFARRDGFVCHDCGEAVNERYEQGPDLAPYNPVCERIEQPSAKSQLADDPTNIAVVHAMCARDEDPRRVTTIPGTIQERSRNDPGIGGERAPGTIRTITPIAQQQQGTDAVETRPNAVSEAVPAGQEIPGTFPEFSWGDGEPGQHAPALETPPEPEQSPAADTLFPLQDQGASAPRKRAAKKTAAAKPAKPVKERNPFDVTADELTKAFYDKHRENLTQGYPALMKMIRTAIHNGIERNALAFALDLLAVEHIAISGGTIRTALTRLEQQHAGGNGVVVPINRRVATTDARLAQAREATAAAKATAREMVRRASGSAG